MFKSFRYAIARRFFNDIIQEQITDASHPDFGWIWQEDQLGGLLLKQTADISREQGYRTALKDIRVMIEHGETIQDINSKIGYLLEVRND